MNFLDHIQSRGPIDNIYHYMDIEQEILSFPIWAGKKLIGYQKYNWRADKTKNNDYKNGRYYTWVSEAYRNSYFYGSEYYRGQSTIYLVEGIWDAIRILNAGYCAFALLGSTPSKQTKGIFNMFWKCNLVAICDNDGAKESISRIADNRLYLPNEYKDCNDMTQADFDKWITLHQF